MLPGDLQVSHTVPELITSSLAIVLTLPQHHDNWQTSLVTEAIFRYHNQLSKTISIFCPEV
jgi:hypothetical protein